MLKVGLVGLGFMGTGHLNTYRQMEQDGLPVKLVAVCDVDENKFNAKEAVKGNIDIGGSILDLSPYNLYNDMAAMIAAESLDYVDLCLPTYLHGPMAVKAMEMGMNVFCEKPMAISTAACDGMIEAARRTGRKLMIGHTLRYWNCYEYLKEVIDSGVYGACVCAYFFRGGGTPKWSWQNWLLTAEKSGGCLLDQHVHDVDAINWLFGMPAGVSSVGRVVFPGSGYDCVSTNYLYGDKAVNAQDDWTINGNGFGFDMLFRVNFERGAVIMEKGITTVYPENGERFVPDLPDESGYYKELRLFAEYLRNPEGFDCIPLLLSHRDTIRLAEAERESCGKNGVAVML